MSLKIALTIAGSDSSGGAGIQADIKNFTLNNIYTLTSVTSLVTMDFNNDWKHIISIVDENFIKSQILSCLSNKPNGIKTGMLPTPEIIELTIECINNYQKNSLIYVFDPVLACKGEDILFPNNIKYMKKLLPLCTIVTPNIQEAELLSEINIYNLETAKKACKIIKKLGAKNIIIKAIKIDDNSLVDLLYDNKNNFIINKHEILDLNKYYNHGAGCTFSANILSNLINNVSLENTFINSSDYVFDSIKNSHKLNKFTGALNINLI